MKIFFRSITQGCVSSQYEISLYRKVIEQIGHEYTQIPDQADVIVLNTCGFTTDREKQAIDAFKEYKEQFPNKKVILGGCLPKINPESYRDIYDGPVFHPEKFEELIEALGGRPPASSPYDPDLIFRTTHQLDRSDLIKLNWKFKVYFGVRDFLFFVRSVTHLNNLYWDNFFKSATLNENNFLIIAARGCLGRCTYCSIKKARGALVSTPADKIMAELEEGLSLGFKDFSLCAEDLGAWGQDFGKNITELFSLILKKNEKFNVVIPFLEPSWMINYAETLKVQLMDSRISSLYIPIHSGSDRVLKRMGRDYSTTDLIPIIKFLKKQRRELVLKTNIIHSFPEETWSEFFLSLRYAASFDIAMAMRFTPRPETPAAKFKNQIPNNVQWLRHVIASAFFMGLNTYRFITNFFGSSMAFTKPERVGN